jgi:hypothetical protein
METNPGLTKLVKEYEKLGYIDQYGGSVVIFIFITLILFIIVSYCISASNSAEIIQDWPNQRCKPTIIPYAGFITHPEGVTAFEYTQENFNYCTQQILSSITGPAVEPYAYIIEIFDSVVKKLNSGVQGIRAIFDRIRKLIEDVTRNIMNRLLNIMVPIQNIILGTKDILGKMQGTMLTTLFTALGGYYALKSLFGAIAQFIANILIALAALIFTLIILGVFFPPSYITAGVMTSIFLLISLPFALVLAFMGEYLGIYGYNIPSLKCFDKNTSILLNDGTIKKIHEIQVGDILENNNEVTAFIKVETKGSIMYYLDGIIVSDTHIVNYKGKWVPVSKHPDSMKCSEYNEPYLYCLNTSNKTITLNNIVFTDWDEIFQEDEIFQGNNDFQDSIKQIMNNEYIKLNNVKDIHIELDSGFEESTRIQLYNGKYKKMKDIIIGDELQNGEKVYGVVVINGSNLSQQYKYILGEKLVVIGGPNLVLCDEKIWLSSTLGICDKVKINKKHDKLYHLLTDKKTFTIENIQFYDYNAAIDIFLEKKDEKLLSMKYV